MKKSQNSNTGNKKLHPYDLNSVAQHNAELKQQERSRQEALKSRNKSDLNPYDLNSVAKHMNFR